MQQEIAKKSKEKSSDFSVIGNVRHIQPATAHVI